MSALHMPSFKAVASYTLLPGLSSRVGGLIPRFWMFAYFMALIFEAVRLLPQGHPYLHASQIGQYRIRDVLAAAANNLRGGIKNADQYIIFITFVLAVVIFAIQFALLIGLIVTQSAHAANMPFLNMFVTVAPLTDVAHLMMDKVFGIPLFFGSCYDPVANGGSAVCQGFLPALQFPTQFQIGMQALFRFYSFGMLAVGGFMLVYYAFALLAETVNTGSPFGRRYQIYYTPLRLILALLLLLPLGHGYNTGQYVVLWAAKWGSGLATNSWFIFNKRVGATNPLGLENQQMVGQPKIQDIDSIINFFYVAQTCRAAYKIAYGSYQPVQAYFVRPGGATLPPAAMPIGAGTSWAAARDFFGQGDVSITFGIEDQKYTKYPASVKPLCGIINMQALSKKVVGVEDVYEVYFRTIMNIWNYSDMTNYGTKMACNLRFAGSEGCTGVTTGAPWDAADTAAAGSNFYITVRAEQQAAYNAAMQAQLDVVRQTENPELIMDGRSLLLGWGGAGIWFNKLVSFNGALVDALMVLPTPTKYPLIMEQVAMKKMALEKKPDSKEKYSLTTSSGKSISIDKHSDMDLDKPEVDAEIAKLMDTVYKEVQNSEVSSKPRVGVSDSPIKSFISLLFGQSGLFDFRSNGEVFPLVKLAMLGRELIDKTVLLLATGGIMIAMDGVVNAVSGPGGELMGKLGTTMISFSMAGITIGVLLYYVVPFLPFLYFFFAVGRWVKAIFEAMVGIPLWALAHMRLGGEGIPGSAASAGYFLILEIFLRPILTLFGLLAAVGIYAAMAASLDSVFNLVVANVGGFDMTTLTNGGADTLMESARDGMDALFYTAIYAVLMYMMATTSFKLIDLIPNAVMRWAGTNVSSFKDGEDVYNSLDRFLTREVQEASGDIARSVSRAGKTAKNVGNAVGESTAKRLYDMDTMRGKN